MAAKQSSPPLDSDTNNVRKRVCKACDRCRLKKSKCDGTTPCSRCKSDNAICVFGERKKSHDKIYPKGYVEMLEHQQHQLVNGLQEMYKRAVSGQTWEGPSLDDSSNGRPLTHDILNSLGVLQQHEAQGRCGSFDEDPDTMQRRLAGDDADVADRRRSFESEGDTDSLETPLPDAGMGRPILTNPFAASQLPTPPVYSPASSQSTVYHPQPTRTWPSKQKTSAIRPLSLQIQPSYAKWDHSNPNAAILQTQNWVHSPTLYETYPPSDFYPEMSSITGLELMSGITMPDWPEDDFVSYVDTPMT